MVKHNGFPSHIALRDTIRYYNIVFPASDTFAAEYTLMPNACGTLSLAFDGTAVKAELWGASLTPILLGMEPNRYHTLLLIQLSPYGLYQITRQNQAEFTDQCLSLAEIDPKLFHSLREAFFTSKTPAELADACNLIFHRRMEQQVISDALLLATAMISERHGKAQVKEVAQHAGYSERQLNRLFLSQIGMNVKSYARLTRFHYVLERIQTSPCFFSALSQQAGYFDQPHFDKDFKAISGVSPREYLRSMSGFYYDGAEIYRTMAAKEE